MLFRSWEVYEAHLPRRETFCDGALDLYGCVQLLCDHGRFEPSWSPTSSSAPQLDGQTSSTRCMGREWARRLASFRVFYMLRALGTSASSTSTWRSTTTGGGFSRPVRSWCTRDEFMRLFETTTLRARALAGSSMFATGALAVLAAAASSLGRCGDDAGTPRCTTMCTFIKPPLRQTPPIGRISTVHSSAFHAWTNNSMRPSRCLGSFNPSECELDGAAIDDAATEKLRQKGMTFLRDDLMHNNHGGLTGLQTGSAELVAFETRIIECTATTGAKKPAGCGQFVPAGILPPPSPRSGKAT